ncbi:hypothetical protein HanPSC8_Chr03g0114481 [Helianthus annuus]|nr:hypothetical protein HanPSC8_Chr03g0114481 [Helianthus annuus]
MINPNTLSEFIKFHNIWILRNTCIKRKINTKTASKDDLSKSFEHMSHIFRASFEHMSQIFRTPFEVGHG